MSALTDADSIWTALEGILTKFVKDFDKWKPSQTDAFHSWEALNLKRCLLFFPTGEGKTYTSLALIRVRGWKEVNVIAPKKTHGGWYRAAQLMGMKLHLYSPELFIRPETKFTRDIPWIVDEVHRLGGRDAAGWQRFERMMRKFQHEVVLMSATPNYNKAERAFCLDVLADQSAIRNYMDWLIFHCEVKASRYSIYPDFVEFKRHDSVIDYISDKRWCFYIEDTADWTRVNLELPDHFNMIYERYGYSRQHKRVVASLMEKFHKRVDQQYIDPRWGMLHEDITESVMEMLAHYPDRKQWLVFCSHKTVADAANKSLSLRFREVFQIDGDTKGRDVEPIKSKFIASDRGFLIGTTAIAEGLDGLDKTCQSLLILDDIRGDHAKRRQVIGRILPRGKGDELERVVVTATIK